MSEASIRPEEIEAALTLVSRETGAKVLPQQTHLLARYAALIKRWNPRTHLVSQGDLRRLSWHFADALLLLALIPEEAQSLVDVGTGGGLPGIPLKIFRPALRLYLVERSRKKAAFLREAVRVLHLSDVEIYPLPFEEVWIQADVGVAKAVGQWDRLQRHLPHLVREGGLFLRVLGRGEKGATSSLPHPLRGHPLRVSCYRVSRETIVPLPCPRL